MADSTTTIQDQILDTIKAGQKSSLDFVRTWADTVASLPSPPTAFDFEGLTVFAQKLWDIERQYAVSVLDALEPVVKPTPPKTRSTATKP